MYIFGLRNENNCRSPRAFGAIQIAFHKWTEVSLIVQRTGTVFGLTLGFLTLSIIGPPRSKALPPVAQPVQDMQSLEPLVREKIEVALRQKNAANKTTATNSDGLSIQ